MIQDWFGGLGGGGRGEGEIENGQTSDGGWVGSKGTFHGGLAVLCIPSKNLYTPICLCLCGGVFSCFFSSFNVDSFFFLKI